MAATTSSQRPTSREEIIAMSSVANADQRELGARAMEAERNGAHLSAEMIRERRDRRWAEYNRTGIYPAGW